MTDTPASHEPQRVEMIVDQMLAEYDSEIQQARASGDAERMDLVAKRVATRVLGELHVPGAVQLHQQIFETVFERLGRSFTPDALDRINYATTQRE